MAANFQVSRIEMKNYLTGITIVAASLLAAGQSAVAQKKVAKLKAIQPEAIKLGRPVDFQRDVAPILEASCVACHNVAIAESKLNVEDVTSILKGGKRGPAVVAKQPDKSLLFQLASHTKAPAMPPPGNKVDAAALTPKQVGIIRQWILEGANAGMSSKGTAVAWAPLPPALNPIFSVALSPWGRYAAAGRANQITVYNLVSGEEAARLIDPALSPIKYDGKAMYPGGAAHRDFVHALAFSPDGNLIASGGFRTVKLWQKVPGAKRYQVPVGAPITAIAVSADGKTAATGAADNSIQLIDTANGKILRKLGGHSSPVTGLAFSADGKTLASCSADKSVRLWNAADGKPIRTIASPAPANDVVFNKDASRIVSAHADNIIRVWQTTAPKTDPKKKDKKDAGEKPVAEMKGHGKPVTSLALLLPAGTQVVSGSEDGTVRIWNISNGSAVRTMNHGAPVTAVAARPDGQAVASSAANGTGKLWQVNNGKQLAELKGRVESQERIAGLTENQEVEKIRLAAAQNGVKTADKTQKDRETALKKSQEDKTKADKAFADAGKKAKPLNEAVAKAKAELAKKPEDKGLKKKLDDAEKAAKKPNDDVQKAKTAKEAADRTLKLAEASVKQAKDLVANAKKDETEATTRKKKADDELKAAQTADKTPAKPLTAIAFSADGKTIATASQDGHFQLWGGNDGTAIDSIQAHKAAASVVAFGPNGLVLTGSADKTLAAKDAKPSWKLVARLGAAGKDPLDLSSSPFVGRIQSLAFSRDGKLLATGGGDPSRSGELFLWDVAGRKMVREIKDAHSDTILGLHFNWDGTQILSGAADKFAKIFDVATGKHVRSFEGHTHHVLSVSWQADGGTIATAGADNVLKVWNTATGEQKRTIAGYNKQVTSVQFIGVSGNVVACSGDKQVRFHRTTNGQPYRGFSGPGDYVYAAAAARNAAAVIASVGGEATVVVAGGEDGVLRVWNGSAQLQKSFEPPKPPASGKAQASVSGKP
jgi:WD40 repeat protein